MLFETLNNRIVQNVTLLFLSLTQKSLFVSLYVQNMSLCAQHSSRPFTDRSSVNFSLLLLLLLFFCSFTLRLTLFSKCTANHPPLFSSRSRSPSSRITRRDSVRLLYRRSLKLPHSTRKFKPFSIFAFVVFCCQNISGFLRFINFLLCCR